MLTIMITSRQITMRCVCQGNSFMQSTFGRQTTFVRLFEAAAGLPCVENIGSECIPFCFCYLLCPGTERGFVIFIPLSVFHSTCSLVGLWRYFSFRMPYFFPDTLEVKFVYFIHMILFHLRFFFNLLRKAF